jgi:hypothetical protein
MLSAYFLTLGLLLAPSVASREIPNPQKLAKYESGEVHNSLMLAKHNAWAKVCELLNPQHPSMLTI